MWAPVPVIELTPHLYEFTVTMTMYSVKDGQPYHGTMYAVRVVCVCERKRVETCRKIRLDQIGNVHWHFVNLGRVILFNITQDTDVIVL